MLLLTEPPRITMTSMLNSDLNKKLPKKLLMLLLMPTSPHTLVTELIKLDPSESSILLMETVSLLTEIDFYN